MAEIGASDSSSTDTDRDFDPSADMLIHDYDDEQTLEEEEALSGESCSNELDDLEKESEMPIEELLAMYRYGGEQQESRSSSEEEILSNQDLTLDKDEIARDLLKHSDDDDDKETSVHDLLNSVHMASSTTARLLRSNSQHGSEDDDSDESDDDYKPVEPVDDWKKTIQVGSDYQAQVPDGLCKYGDAPAYENEDRLLWDPSKLEDPVVEKYLDDVHTQAILNATGIDSIPTGQHIRDDEQALYLLLQCGHNVEEALRRRKMQAVPPSDPMSLWSEEECRNFENGLRIYGKDFYLIQQNKVKTRSVGELIQFYYLWKKTERHDIFANKNRIEKRKYTLHPGITDYMDRFLDDQETPLIPPPAKERSSSPVTSLIFGDPKRNQIKTSVESSASDVAGVIEPSEPPQFDLSAASPTILTMRPDLKRPKSSSPMKDVLGSSTTGEDHSLSNGVVDKEDLEPVVKKIKAVPDTSSFYELQESYSDAKPSPLEGKSVAQMTSKDSNMSVEHSSLLSTALSLPSDLHTVTSHHFTESVAQ